MHSVRTLEIDFSRHEGNLPSQRRCPAAAPLRANTPYSSVRCKSRQKIIYECFRGVSYGLQMSKLVMCPTCEKLRHRQTKGLHYIRVDIDWVKAFGCQSDHRLACGSRGPCISRYIDVFGSVPVLGNIAFFHVPWGFLTMRL